MPGSQSCSPKPDRRGQRAVDDRDGARRTAQQDRLGQRAMQRHLEARGHGIGASSDDAPPAKMKNVRKKLEAANAIERPKTIWISRRKPPLVSPKASVRPGDDDDDHCDDLGDRPLDGIEDRLQGCFPRHVGTGGVGRRAGQRLRCRMRGPCHTRRRRAEADLRNDAGVCHDGSPEWRLGGIGSWKRLPLARR